MICLDAGLFFDASAWVTGLGIFVSLSLLAACLLTKTRDRDGNHIEGSENWRAGFMLALVVNFLITATFVYSERESIRGHQSDMAIRGVQQPSVSAK